MMQLWTDKSPGADGAPRALRYDGAAQHQVWPPLRTRVIIVELVSDLPTMIATSKPSSSKFTRRSDATTSTSTSGYCWENVEATLRRLIVPTGAMSPRAESARRHSQVLDCSIGLLDLGENSGASFVVRRTGAGWPKDSRSSLEQPNAQRRLQSCNPLADRGLGKSKRLGRGGEMPRANYRDERGHCIKVKHYPTLLASLTKESNLVQKNG